MAYDESEVISAGRRLTQRRHPEWSEHQLRWRFLLDSLEGGDRYRQAVYGVDTRGLPIRNLIRHKREYPDPREKASSLSTYLGGNSLGLAGALGQVGAWGDAIGGVGTGSAGMTPGSVGSDPYGMATDDDYELRRARTPVPTFMVEAIDTHLGKIFSREVERIIPEGRLDVMGWTKDTDGLGTDIDTWMVETVGPLLLALGQIDLCFDHPAIAEDAEPAATRADEERLGLNRCVVSYILPENLVWWKLREGRRYAECLVKEYESPDHGDPTIQWRHWAGSGWTLYDAGGKVIGTGTHNFGHPPIRRFFDRRKERTKNIGKARYEAIADRQREYYNRDSELILSDTTQAHPLLQGPEDYIKQDGSLPIGPTWLLPKKKSTSGSSTAYEGFEIIEFPKDGADSIRRNKQDIRDEVDRDASLNKPAGASSSGPNTVAQSGISKQMDNQTGHDRLTNIAKMLARVEREIFCGVLNVLADSPDGEDAIDEIVISYPMDFQLELPATLIANWTGLNAMVDQMQGCIETNLAAIMDVVRGSLKGRSDEFYEDAMQEFRERLEANEMATRSSREMRFDGSILDEQSSDEPAETAGENEEAGAETDRPSISPTNFRT